jgi:hypothetical protein
MTAVTVFVRSMRFGVYSRSANVREHKFAGAFVLYAGFNGFDNFLFRRLF